MFLVHLDSFGQLLSEKPIQKIETTPQVPYVQNISIERTTDGVLFIGTNGGLSSFDGSKWRFTHIANGLVSTIKYDQTRNRLWIGGRNEFGFIDLDNTNIKPDPIHAIDLNNQSLLDFTSVSSLVPDAFLPIGRIENILVLDNDNVLFNSYGKIFRWDGHKIYVTTHNEAFWRMFLVEDEVWVNAASGLMRLEGDSLSLLPGGEFAKMKGIYGVFSHPEGGWWIPLDKTGLAHFKDGKVKMIPGKAGEWISKGINGGVALPNDGFVLSSFQQGLLQVDSLGSILDTINEEKGLFSNLVYSTFLDSFGNLWFTHNEGLTRIPLWDKSVHIGKDSGLDGFVIDVHPFENGTIIGTSEKLFLKQNKQKELFTIPISGDYFHLGFRYQGDFIFSSGDRFQRLNPINLDVRPAYELKIQMSEWDSSPLVQNLICGFVHSTVHCIEFLDNHAFHKRSFTISGGTISSLVFDKKGDLWIGMNYGKVFRVTSHELNMLLESQNDHFKPKAVSIGVNLDANDRSFVELFLLKESIQMGIKDRFYEYRPEQKLFLPNPIFPRLSQINTYISRVLVQNQDRIIINIGRRYRLLSRNKEGLFQERPSLLSQQFFRQTTFARIADEHFYLGSEKGLDIISLNQVEVLPDLVPSIITRMQHRDSLLFSNITSKEQAVLAQPLTYDLNAFRIEFSQPILFSSEQPAYQTRLLPLEKQWAATSSESFRDYTNIDEGSYTFEIRAQDLFGRWSNPTRLNFAILPPWHRTWWAYLLYGFVLLGTIYLIYWLRTRYLKNRDRIRRDLANDLHDQVSSSLSSIGFFVEALRRGANPSNQYLSLIEDSASEAKHNISDIIWTTNPANDDWNLFMDRAIHFARNNFESKNIKLQLDCYTTESKIIDLRLKQDLWLIFKECCTNILRHSKAKSAKIKFHILSDTIILHIEDDGIGLDEKQAISTGNGLLSIKKRGERCKMNAALESKPGKTVWRFERFQ